MESEQKTVKPPSQWLEHCKQTKKENPQIIQYKEILKLAKTTYKK